MRCFEYRIFSWPFRMDPADPAAAKVEQERTMNEYGAEGWELVQWVIAMDVGTPFISATFKREIANERVD